MPTAAESSARFLFTAPWEPVVVRRGDALGLRAFADQLADAVAPGMSNRVRDGRWVTILAWCLARSHEVFHARGGRGVQTRAEQVERYAWLRPLELMWVARTIAVAKEDWRERPLSGQRRVRPWYEDEMANDRFGMTVDQFRAYRQTGMYGGYRRAFRMWPGLTVSRDGWTPGDAARKLASWMDKKLKSARPAWPLHEAADHEESPLTRVPKLGKGEKHDWWLRHWPNFTRGSGSADQNTLPRRWDDHAPLPERELLEAVAFAKDADGLRRRRVAQEVARSKASTHVEVCEHLRDVFGDDAAVALLPRFSRMADAGLSVLSRVGEALEGSPRVSLAEIASRADVADACDELMAAAGHWREGADGQVRHVDSAHRFAETVPRAGRASCLTALLRYHETHGGGLRWFALRGAAVEPRSPVRAGSSSSYRFRLWPLCRIAAQCEVVRSVPDALLDDAADPSNEEELDE